MVEWWSGGVVGWWSGGVQKVPFSLVNLLLCRLAIEM